MFPNPTFAPISKPPKPYSLDPLVRREVGDPGHDMSFDLLETSLRRFVPRGGVLRPRRNCHYLLSTRLQTDPTVPGGPARRPKGPAATRTQRPGERTAETPENGKHPRTPTPRRPNPGSNLASAFVGGFPGQCGPLDSLPARLMASRSVWRGGFFTGGYLIQSAPRGRPLGS